MTPERHTKKLSTKLREDGQKIQQFSHSLVENFTRFYMSFQALFIPLQTQKNLTPQSTIRCRKIHTEKFSKHESERRLYFISSCLCVECICYMLKFILGFGD